MRHAVRLCCMCLNEAGTSPDDHEPYCLRSGLGVRGLRARLRHLIGPHEENSGSLGPYRDGDIGPHFACVLHKPARPWLPQRHRAKEYRHAISCEPVRPASADTLDPLQTWFSDPMLRVMECTHEH